jgi:hypothetical protein
MEKINWSGYEWRLQEEWGEYHPEHTYKWTDPSATQILANGCLDLMTQHNPKQFGDLNIPTGCGMVCSVQGFGWGSFEIEAKLPTGMHLWPAFWLSPLDQWPPEVDVFEGYSTRKPNYRKFDLLNPLKWYKLESNAFVSKPGHDSHWKEGRDNEPFRWRDGNPGIQPAAGHSLHVFSYAADR